MTPDQIITLIIIIIMAILFASNRVRVDLVALMVMVALGLTGVVQPGQVFSGFSSSAVMIILGISIISIALQLTGAINSLGKLLHKFAGGKQTLLIFFVALTAALVSLIMNNIAAVGVLLPAVMAVSRKSKVPPSQLLMPLAFGTILGGMATLLTTSNIIVSGALKDAGLPYFGMLDYLPIGGPVMVAGVLFLTFLGARLLPSVSSTGDIEVKREVAEKLSDLYQVRKNLIRIEILSGSPMARRSIVEGRWANQAHVNILAVFRGKEAHFSPEASLELLAGDIVIARGHLTNELTEQLHLKVTQVDESGFKVANEANPLAEIIISPRSKYIGRTIREVDFREHHLLNVVGIWRAGKPIEENLSDLTLQFGDALLVQGPAVNIRKLNNSEDLVVLEEDPNAVMLPRKGLITILITLLTLTLAALNIHLVALIIMAGAVLLMLTGSVSLNEVYRQMEWRPIFLIAGLWPLSIALQETGLATLAVTAFLNLIGNAPPIAIISAVLFITMLVTLLISGQVTAIIMIPLALVAANSIGIDPRSLAMAVAMGCSLAFISPIGHPVNIMVMNPGGYTFKDYIKVGLPLTVLSFIIIIIAIQIYWGL